MNRRFNSTGRAKIARDKITIRIVDDGADGQSKFTADLGGLADLTIDPTARVIIEPYVQQSSMRFDFGPFGNIIPPYDTSLAEIDRGASVQFRIKVVDTAGNPGRLLAVADQIRPVEESDDDDRKSILPLKFTDLGEAVWRIVVAADERPVLEVNNRIPDIGNRLTIDPLLRGAIFPVAVREVLRVILSEEADTERDWVREWRQFAAGLLREPLDEETFEPDATRDLIERVVENFCERETWATLAQPINAPPWRKIMSDSIRQFTSSGNEEFRAYLESLQETPNASLPQHLLTDPATSEAVSFDVQVERTPLGRIFDNRAEFGQYLVETLKVAERTQISLNSSLWNWLALYFLDQLCPPDDTGARRPEAIARYYLPEKFRHNRYYRHLVRSPWLAVTLHPVTSRVILIPVSSNGSPLATVGEIFEQIASRQGVFRSARIMAAVDALYFDSEKGRPRRGTAGSAGGSPRRLGHVLKQFELTYDLDWDSEGLVLELLPKEFDSWKSAG